MNSLTIHGDPKRIYAYASMVERWPEILPHYRHVSVLEEIGNRRLVAMHCVRPFGFFKWPCHWRAHQVLRPDEGRILFDHVSGPAKGMKVEWRLENRPGGVLTSIRHEVDSSRNPLADFYWNWIVAPIFVSAIAQRTLETIKRIVESEESL